METILYWLAIYSAMYNIDPLIAASVIKVESNYDSTVVGEVGELGLMQVRPEYSVVSANLLKTQFMNIQIGIKKLAKAKELCKHKKEHTWLVCYNVGVFGGSKIKRPKKFNYYKKVIEVYNELKNSRCVKTSKGDICSKSILTKSDLNLQERWQERLELKGLFLTDDTSLAPVQ